MWAHQTHIFEEQVNFISQRREGTPSPQSFRSMSFLLNTLRALRFLASLRDENLNLLGASNAYI